MTRPRALAAQVLYSPKVSIVLFYSPTCPHCTKLAPAFKEAAKTLAAEGITVAALDAAQARTACSQGGRPPRPPAPAKE